MKLTIGHVIIFLILGGLANFHKTLIDNKKSTQLIYDSCSLKTQLDSTYKKIEDSSYEHSKKINTELKEVNKLFIKTKKNSI